MRLFLFSISFPVASAAMSRSIRMMVGVFLVIFMPTWTVGYRPFSGDVTSPGGGIFVRDDTRSGSNSAPQIFATSDRLQMGWIDATSHAAEMIEVQTFWNWTNKNLVRDAMGRSQAIRSLGFVSDIKSAVSISVSVRSCEQPASGIRIRRNVPHEAVNQGYASIAFSHVTPFKSHRSGLLVSGQDVAARSYFTPISPSIS